jgi:hypothetical protein
VFDLTLIAALAAFTLFMFVLAKLASGSSVSVLDIFVAPTLPPRPRGTQEMDLPPFCL